MNIDLGHDEGGPSEFLHLEYADKATLYVPVAQLHLIARYNRRQRGRGAAAPARLGPMGQGQEARRRASARQPPPSS